MRATDRTAGTSVVGALAHGVAVVLVGGLLLVGWRLVGGEWRWTPVVFAVMAAALLPLFSARASRRPGPGGLSRGSVDEVLRTGRLPDDVDAAAWRAALAARRTEAAPMVTGALVGLGACAVIVGLLTADQGWGWVGWAVTAALIAAAVPARPLARRRLATVDRLAGEVPRP